MHQAFFDAWTSWRDGNEVTLRAGRQEMAYGSQRLISVRDSPNNRLAFDAVRVLTRFGDWRADACHMNASSQVDLILHNGRITTLDPKYPEAKYIAVEDGRIVGVDDAENYERGPNTKVNEFHAPLHARAQPAWSHERTAQ